MAFRASPDCSAAIIIGMGVALKALTGRAPGTLSPPGPLDQAPPMSITPSGPVARLLLVVSMTIFPAQSSTDPTASAVFPHGVARTTTSLDSTHSSTFAARHRGPRSEITVSRESGPRELDRHTS